MRDITELPHDLFLIIISYLPPPTCVRCRSVSRRWHAAFTDEDIALLLLRWNFPRCRELRLATAAASLLSATPHSAVALPNNLKEELQHVTQEPRTPWSGTFADVARRYHNLNQAKCRDAEKLEMATCDREHGSSFSFWGVAPWNRYLRLNEKTSNFHYPDPQWWYSQEDGVLVYPAASAQQHSEGYVYHVVDLSSGYETSVPFDVRSKHIRRVRLAKGVLLFEWAEANPYHQLNDREVVHRHFVTLFDAVRTKNTWSVVFRSEFKLHFLGLPLNRSDRFFSAHTSQLYAVYFWQPNRSLYQDDPIEQLAVWDISTPSSYRPSEDPTGDKRPGFARTPSTPPPTGLWNGPSKRYKPAVDLETPRRASLAAATAGPQVVRRMAWRELDFYGLRQRATPRLRSLALDDRNLYVVEEEHRWADGQHSSLSPPRVHLVRCTGIPVIPIPGGNPLAPNLATKSTTDLLSGASSSEPVISTIIDGPVMGPVWQDECGSDGDVNMNFCRRVADANGLDQSNTTGVVWPPPLIGALNVASQENLVASLRPRPPSASATGWPWVLAQDTITTLSSRWPGWAPCWRHEDFPYLTVGEMVDFAAGIRITARHCFMLETLSVHIRPAISVKGQNRQKSEVKRDRNESERRQEVEFPDNMWSQLLGKGCIFGDERWLIGEDEKERITVLRF
ncbi:hypothetical protein QBC38DRAFT_452112 [Podospora fimiseda]|uniref:F-box domain-containing protein n=1 Tax=Podospora fimiseda TaxID=252190 RepID=A0AAN7H028_9PEZI|nr:hypothetical protein QBC38DRAFT_452112 [Podospora fimiseda]